MKVDGVQSQVQLPKVETASNYINTKVNKPQETTKENKDKEKTENNISDKIIIDAIEKANKAMKAIYREFQFSIHEETKQITVKVLDSETKEVIREIPSEKVLDMVAKLWEMAGLIVDESR